MDSGVFPCLKGGCLFLQQLVNGLTIGGIYAMIAVGYTMIYGVVQLINFAHGEIYMLGAFFAVTFISVLGLSLIHISEPTRPFTLSRMPSSA